MSFEDKINQMREVRKCIADKAPRDDEGRIAEPFGEWLSKIDDQVKKATAWQLHIKEGARENNVGRG